MTTQEISAAKKALRKELLARRNALDETDQCRAEILITERILGHQWYYLSDDILCFASYGSEIRTGQIMTESIKRGKKLFLPKVIGDEIRFYLADPSSVIVGYKGIPEPVGDMEEYEYLAENVGRTLLLMPGVGFDPYRNRLGYGKGFYDRFLADKEELWYRSIAIGHKCQMVDKLPSEEHDRKPYQVILV